MLIYGHTAHIWAHRLYLGTPSSMACLIPRLSLLCLLSFPFQLFLISCPLKSLSFPLLITQTKPNYSGSIVTKPLTLYLIPRHHHHLFFSFIFFLISFSSHLVPELVTCWVSTKKVHNWRHVTMSQPLLLPKTLIYSSYIIFELPMSKCPSSSSSLYQNTETSI